DRGAGGQWWWPWTHRAIARPPARSSTGAACPMQFSQIPLKARKRVCVRMLGSHRPRQPTSHLLRQLLDALVACVGDVDGALTIDRDAAWREEGARLGGRPGRVCADHVAPCREWLPSRRQFLNPTVARISNVHVAVRIDG